MYDSATGIEYNSPMEDKYAKYGGRIFTTPSEPQTKFDRVKALVAEEKYKEAMSIVKTFAYYSSKEDKDAIVVAHESHLNPAFYASIGYDPQTCWDRGVEVLKRIYGDTE